MGPAVSDRRRGGQGGRGRSEPPDQPERVKIECRVEVNGSAA